MSGPDDLVTGEPARPARGWLLPVLGLVVVAGLVIAALTGRHGDPNRTAPPPSTPVDTDTFVPAPGATPPPPLPPDAVRCTNCTSRVLGGIAPGPRGLRIAVGGDRGIRILDAATGTVSDGPALPVPPDGAIATLQRTLSGWAALVSDNHAGPQPVTLTTGDPFSAQATVRPVGDADELFVGADGSTWLQRFSRPDHSDEAVQVGADGRVLRRLPLGGGQQLVGITADRLAITTIGASGETSDGQGTERLVLRDPARRADDVVIPYVSCALATGAHQVAWVSLSGVVASYDTRTGRTTRAPMPFRRTAACGSGAYSPEGHHLVVQSDGAHPDQVPGAGWYGELYVFDVATGVARQVRGVDLAPKQTAVLAWSGPTLAIGVRTDASTTIALWDSVGRRLTRPPVRPPAALAAEPYRDPVLAIAAPSPR